MADAVKLDLFIYQPRLEEMAARAEQARSGRFSGVFVAETLGDPFQSLAVASAQAPELEIGSAVALAFPRSPMITALSAWDLHRSSGGRFVLGLGAQVKRHVERRFSSVYGKPGKHLREYVRAVRHIWGAFQGEHPLDFHGEYYDFDYFGPAFSPGPLEFEPPPIYLAAVGPLMFQSAGEVADGAFIHPVHTDEYLATVAEPAIRRGLEASGRSREELTLSATSLPIVGSGQEGAEARERMRNQFAFYASTPAYRPVLETHGWGELGEMLTRLVRKGDTEAMAAAVSDEVLDTFCTVADTWSEAADRACERYAGIADRVCFHTAPPVGEQLPLQIKS